MTRLRLIGFAFLLLTLLSSCCRQAEPSAKYVFLFIGDGMGISQVIAAEAFRSAAKEEDQALMSFRQFPVTGLSTTYAANRYITGSAAAGTALASGEKTNINRIGMGPSGEEPLQSIAYSAKEKGMKVGIISSVSIDHATPAAFYARQPDRNMYFEIGADLANSGFDFFGGGGFVQPKGVLDGDSVDLFEYARKMGYQLINDAEGFKALDKSDIPVLFINPMLAEGASMYYAIDQPEGYISLANITEKAIRCLDNENGFFMMVEGGKIDWVCHANDAASVVREVIDFSDAVAEAVKFYKQHPDETLIVVTADHETGGLAIGNREVKYKSDFSLLANQGMSGEAFNEVLHDWYLSEGNEAGFAGFLRLLEEHFGLGPDGAPIVLTEEDVQELRELFNASGNKTFEDYGSYHRLTFEATSLLSGKAGLGWTTSAHTGVAVPVYALGVNEEAFSGSQDNTDIPKKIHEALRGRH